MMEYNEDKFFNPNICHVCKRNQIRNTCECRLVSYCTVEHKQLYMDRHMVICVAFQKLFVSHPQLWNTTGLNLEEWIQTRKEFIRLVKLELQRELTPHEVEIIMLAKSCLICRTQTDLWCCVICYSVNFCNTHWAQRTNHPHCEQLRICMKLRGEEMFCGETQRLFENFPDKNRPVLDMDTFITIFVFKKNVMEFEWDAKCYVYSDYVSGPLTLTYGMHYLDMGNPLHNPPSCYVIHIIDASLIDKKYLHAWEIFLHIVPNIKVLKVILISPILLHHDGYIELCNNKCLKSHQILNFQTYGMSYPNYVASDHYRRPNVIVGFQAELNNWPGVNETIMKIQELRCPLLLTTKSQLEARKNMIKIKEVLIAPSNDSLYLAYSGENKFSSKRPYRDLENNGVYYRNKYLTVFYNLNLR